MARDDELLRIHSASQLTPGDAEVEGTATDAKAGAILLVGTVPVYVAGRDRWSPVERGAVLRIRGQLERTAWLPPPATTDGEVQQGGPDGVWVLQPA